MDGQPLPSTQWPLALVGSAVDSQHQIGMITKIKLVFPYEQPSPTTDKVNNYKINNICDK